MARLKYRDWAPRGDSLAVVDHAQTIVADYAAQGLDLTLRQLYYRFVAAGLLPNTDRSYKRLGSIVDDARMAGLLDWNAIVDRTRKVVLYDHQWDSAEEFAQYQLSNGFGMSRWRTQPTYVEVWVEKEALAGVIQRSAARYRAPAFSCRGYVSQSAMWRAARRIGSEAVSGKQVVILHLGDHDPSGIDMTRDIDERLNLFIATDWGYSVASDVEVRRIALTMDQIEEQNPPPNPAKVTDARFAGYEAIYGDESWELDALEPSYLADLIEEHIRGEIDHALWAEAEAEEEEQQTELSLVSNHWREAVDELADRYREDDDS